MRRLSFFAALFVATVASTALGQSTTPEHFRPMEFMVGSCWIGTFPDGKATDEHCFEWMYDRKFIRDRHVVRGGPPYEGETIYALDAKEKRVTYWYFSSAGGLSTGQMLPEGESLVFPERHTSASGVIEIKSVWTRAGADAIRVESMRKDGSEWKMMWTMELKRR